MAKETIDLPTFYICTICGNIVEMINNAGPVPVCCGVEMDQLAAGVTDVTAEKHVPEITSEDHKVVVEVGSKPHPMDAAHHIEWVELITNKGIQRRHLYPKEKAIICFPLGKHETVAAVYAYCNIHGLWAAFPGK